jgi:hypothetical protein
MELPTTQLSTSGLQTNLINSSSSSGNSSGVHGSKALESLMTRVSSALDKMALNSGGTDLVSCDDVKRSIAGKCGVQLPGLNQNCVV